MKRLKVFTFEMQDGICDFCEEYTEVCSLAEFTDEEDDENIYVCLECQEDAQNMSEKRYVNFHKQRATMP